VSLAAVPKGQGSPGTIACGAHTCNARTHHCCHIQDDDSEARSFCEKNIPPRAHPVGNCTGDALPKDISLLRVTAMLCDDKTDCGAGKRCCWGELGDKGLVECARVCDSFEQCAESGKTCPGSSDVCSHGRCRGPTSVACGTGFCFGETPFCCTHEGAPPVCVSSWVDCQGGAARECSNSRDCAGGSCCRIWSDRIQCLGVCDEANQGQLCETSNECREGLACKDGVCG
jgi:hypothetical protein